MKAIIIFISFAISNHTQAANIHKPRFDDGILKNGKNNTTYIFRNPWDYWEDRKMQPEKEHGENSNASEYANDVPKGYETSQIS